jgi:GT2 family glycosyltransferase
MPDTIRYLHCAQQGKSFALNAGLAVARAPIVAFTDDDVTFAKGWLAELRRAFDDPEVVGVAGRIAAVWSTPIPEWHSDSPPYLLMNVIVRYDLGDDQRDVAEAPFGANMAFRRSTFERFGGFRTDIGPRGDAVVKGEDTEFGSRVLESGARIRYAPAALVYHPVDPARATRKYFEEWYYGFGRVSARCEKLPADVRWLFGAPRYLWRALASHGIRSVVTPTDRGRFYHRLQARMTLGSIREHRSSRGG